MLPQETLVTRTVACSRITVILLAVFFLPGRICRAQEKTDIDVPTSASKTEGAAALEALIQEIEENEALYKKLQIGMARSMVDQADVFPYDGPKPIRQNSKLSLIVQGNMFRNQTQTKGLFVSRAIYAFPSSDHPLPNIKVNTGTEENMNVFNGTIFRSFWKDIYDAKGEEKQPRIRKKGIISDQTPGVINLARPHMLLFEFIGSRVPLSVYLKGIEAVREFTGDSELKSKYKTRVQVRGIEKVQGLECTVVRIETVDPTGNSQSRRDLWLARDRNLIPIRKLCFYYRDSTELPNMECLVEAWQEVRPGVWFPRKAYTERYNSMILKRTGKQQTSWRYDYSVETVELDPKLPKDIFTKLDFETGTRVNVFQDDKMTRSFTQE
ncbi:outer membrane lipoprotein-sorting protein [Gimesia aquarii]|uniref:Uncharacterized protein n=1 Tax=Gimesia aquarii TaxID=2527964 RepID=A0A517VUX7_9PLAN|nr:outer membrane lipoprotein-sorting protein [Gimesia aquarii]QDT96804.1 hypothetical protein V144x_22620 [Gimesia aquarii]